MTLFIVFLVLYFAGWLHTAVQAAALLKTFCHHWPEKFPARQGFALWCAVGINAAIWPITAVCVPRLVGRLSRKITTLRTEIMNLKTDLEESQEKYDQLVAERTVVEQSEKSPRWRTIDAPWETQS